jgi:hypothetical protein
MMASAAGFIESGKGLVDEKDMHWRERMFLYHGVEAGGIFQYNGPQ